MQWTIRLVALALVFAAPAQALVFEDQKLFADEPAANASFGAAVAASGRTAAIAAPRGAGFSGTVEVFGLTGAGESAAWVSRQVLAASDASSEDYFGTAVSISEDEQLLLIGAPGQDDVFGNAGGAYVFRRGPAGVWAQEQALACAPSCGTNHELGTAVALSGDVAVVGSPYAAGTFVFRRGTSSWTREQLLEPKARVVAASGDVIALAGGFLGANRVFRHGGAGWEQEFEFDALPVSWIALSGDVLAIGSNGDDELATNAGAVYVYRHDGATWQLEQKVFASDGDAGDGLGVRVALAGDRLLAVAGGDLDGRRSAYLFVWNGALWGEVEKLAASDGSLLDNFGIGETSTASALTANGAMIGAYADEDYGVRSGSAYAFRAPEPAGTTAGLSTLAGLVAVMRLVARARSPRSFRRG